MERIIEEHRKELELLCARHRVRRLEVFGSVVTERFDPGLSDLDFLVELEPGSPGELADRYLGLLTGLERLFGNPVDLLMPAAIRNPYFLQQIGNSRTLLYLK